MSVDTGDDDRPLVELDLNAHGVIIGALGDAESTFGIAPTHLVGHAASSHIHHDDLAVASTVFAAVLDSTDDAVVDIRVRIGSDASGWAPVACELQHHHDRPGLRARIRPSQAFTDNAGLVPVDAQPPIVISPLAEMLTDPFEDHFLMATAAEPTFLSPGVTRIFGMTSEEFFSAFGNLLHPDDGDKMVDLLSRLATGSEPYVRVVVRALRVDGTWGTFQVTTRDLSADPDFGSFVTAIRELEEPHVHDADDEVSPELRHALNLAADPILVLSDDGRVRYASTSTERLVRRSPDSITVRPMTELLTPDSLEAFDAWWSGPAETVCHVKFESTTGPPRWVAVRTVQSGTSQRDPEGGEFRVVALRDVDDQVRAEAALREREARFAALMRNSSSGVVVLGDDDRVAGPGHALEQVLGLESDKVSGADLVADVDPADRPGLHDMLAVARSQPGPADITVRQRVANGTRRWIHWTAEDHRSDPAIRGVVVNLDDRTDGVEARLELEESERRLRAIVDHSFEVTVIADAEFTVLWASPSISELLGWDVEDVVGQRVLDFVHPDDEDLALVRYDRARLDDGPEPSIPIRIRTTSGQWRHVAVVAADRRDDPDINGIILNLRDAEAQVSSARALAESENRYRMLVENSTDVVAIMDELATVIWVSPTVKTVMGYEPEELIGHATGGIDDLSERDDLADAFRSILEHPGASTRLIAKLGHADGTRRWVDLVLTNRFDEPAIGGIVAAYRDVTDRVEANRSREASEERFRSLAESSPLGIFQLDRNHECIYVNDRWCEITGRTLDDVAGDRWRTSFGVDGDMVSDGSTYSAIQRLEGGIPIVRPDGSTRWCTLRIAPLTDAHGEPNGSVGTLDDITSMVAARHEANRLSSILESSPDLVLVFTPLGEVVYLNEAARRFFLIDPEESIEGLTADDLLPTTDRDTWTSAIIPTLKRRLVWQGEVVITNRAGDSIPISAVVNVHRDARGVAEVVSVTARDMTERADLEARLEHQATHDPLTGLPNRSLLLDRLGVALGRSSRNSSHLAVLFADLDRFKVVNDGLGHAAGDELLMLVARRLESTVRPGDTVARLGGDEFIIVCEDLDDPADATDLAERISAAVTEPVSISGSEFVVSVSIGITVVDDPTEDPDQVIRDADAAMYLAKQRGRARWEIFDRELRTRASQRLGVENALRRALAVGELVLHYQPVVDTSTDQTIGAEALVRWDHPTRGLLAPAEFLDIAEDSGLIVPIGDWVLATACAHTRPLLEHDPRLVVAVNLSARQIDDPGLITRIESILGEAGVPPDRVILEITEGMLMRDAKRAGATLAELKRLGVGLAIDDFGTGYSSLSYLHRYPIDILKIDRSFVAGLGRDSGEEAIVEAIIELARALELRTVAEGVETRAQLEVLGHLGCRHIQGYLKSRPLDESAYAALIMAGGVIA
ncbi:MAG: PAS domain S-box protein [Actinobacteria bacterium]|nr:PAS domain S-box protein [Actinomycetota bacterium]